LRVFGSTTRKRTPKRVKFLIGAQVEAVAKARRHRARPRDDRRACQPEVGAAELRRGNDADLPGCLVCYAKRGGRHRRVIARPFRMYRRGRSPYSRVAGDRSSPVPQVSRTCCRDRTGQLRAATVGYVRSTERRSLLQVYRFEFGRFRHVSKPTGRRKKTQAPQGDKVREEILRCCVRSCRYGRAHALISQAPNGRSAGVMSWRCDCVRVRSGSRSLREPCVQPLR
jgi:hypothetical protein